MTNYSEGTVIHLRLPGDLADMLTELARKAKRTRHNLIRVLLEEGVERRTAGQANEALRRVMAQGQAGQGGRR